MRPTSWLVPRFARLLVGALALAAAGAEVTVLSVVRGQARSVRRGADGVTVVEMAGLGRSESAKVPEELGDLAGILYDRAPGAPEPEEDSQDHSDAEPDAGSPDQDDSTTPDPQVVPAEGAEK
jgi:cytochrome c biogenesis protein